MFYPHTNPNSVRHFSKDEMIIARMLGGHVLANCCPWFITITLDHVKRQLLFSDDVLAVVDMVLA